MRRLSMLVTVTVCLTVLLANAPSQAGGKPGTPPADPRIAYIVLSTGGKSGDKLYVSNADGWSATAIYTAGSAVQLDYPSWSPDGKSIVFEHWFDGIVAIDVDVVNDKPTGSNPRTLQTRGAVWGTPRWSPLGDEILAYGMDDKSIVVFPSTLCEDSPCEVTAVYVCPDGFAPAGVPTWDWTGKHIALIELDLESGRSGDPHYRIRVIDRATGSVQQEFDMYPMLPRTLAWARHSNTLAISAWPNNEGGQGTQLYLLNLDGPSLIPLGGGHNPSWSPDDAELVFDTSSTPLQLKIINLETGAVRQISKSGMQPDWRRDQP